MEQRSLSRFLVVASAAALVLSACGSDDDNATAVDAVDTATTDASSDSSVDNAAQTTAADATDTDTGTTIDSSSDDAPVSGDANSMYCRSVRGEVEMPADLDVLGNFDLSDPEAMSDMLADAQANLGETVEIAPDELKDDFRTVLEGSMTMVSEMLDAGGDISKIDASAFETPEFEAAAERVETYNVDVCGYDVTTATMPGLDDADTTATLLTQVLGPLQAQMNLSDDQVACLSDKMAESMAASGGVPAMDAVMTYLTDCGIDPSGG
ncbi:MAG TPA: hypothetical protein VMM60_15985 [Ilumatobacter sp.]|nr:hypothetical protein [Ilumatobacter sp.]